MRSDDVRGIIELSNINLNCVIFKIDSENNLEILATAQNISEGIHNGVIVNLTKASNAIRLCISSAEKKVGILLKKINVVVEQPEFLCTKFSKHKKIDGSKIDKDDIEFLLKEAKKEVSVNDNTQSIIHIFNHNYIVDGKTFLEEPINVYADFLSHEMTFISMPKNNLKNINQAFIDCDIEIERIISSTYALAVQLLEDDDLKEGSILINIGFEKTSLGLFKNFALVHSITIPIGANHIIKDISKVCSLSVEESNIIAKKIDFSFEDNNGLFDQNDYLKSIYFNNSNFRKISKNLIINIIQSRLNEILEIIKKQINTTKLPSSLGINLFMLDKQFTFYNLENYFSNFFSSNVKKLNNTNKKNNKEDVKDEFEACLGALKIIKDGWETEAIPKPANKHSQKNGFFSKIFGI